MSILQHENVSFIPSIHQRIAFAEEVRFFVRTERPDCIAVELPRALAPWIERGVMSLPQISVVCLPYTSRNTSESPSGSASDDEMLVVPIDPNDAMIEAVRLGLEEEIPVEWIDAPPSPLKFGQADLPDDLIAERAGMEAYVDKVLPYLDAEMGAPTPQRRSARTREAHMALRLLELSAKHKSVLCVLGIAHLAGVKDLLEAGSIGKDEMPGAPSTRDRVAPFLTHLAPASVSDFLRELPYATHQRESARRPLGAGEGHRFDKFRALREMLKTCETEYVKGRGDTINVTQWKALYQYTRNLAIVQGRLQPDLYTLVTGARDTIDGDYGYTVYERARSYPLQDEESPFPTLETGAKGERGKLSGRDGDFGLARFFGEPQTERVRMLFHRRPPRHLIERWSEQWQGLDMRGICSWPPEDETQERFMLLVRRRALQLLTEDKKQIVEYSTSMLDGLDIRETMRNWHTRKLFVQQTPQPHGKIGSVVLIFDAPPFDAKYSWDTTLYAENNNESDISFYATPMGQDVVGPRISRTEFGGILSVYPSIGIPDIWSFPGIERFENKAEILLAAGILFSPDRFVAYVAPTPPNSRLKNLAAEYERRIVYLPLTGFPRTQIKRIRKFHILNGRDVRSYAADYIFDD